jgi:hypothetical protein
VNAVLGFFKPIANNIKAYRFKVTFTSSTVYTPKLQAIVAGVSEKDEPADA